MENGLDKKMKDKQIPEEELFDELDAMYQRVADIEKEEAAGASVQGETALFLEPSGTPAVPEKELKKKTGRKNRRDYRPMILATTAGILIFILAVTFWKPMAILQLLKIGETQRPVVSPPPRPKKPPSVATPRARPSLPSVATSPAPPASPTDGTPPATTPLPPQSFPARAKQETVKSPQKEAERAKPVSQETVKPEKAVPQGKYYAVQVGSFRSMENVRDLAEVLKKEGLDAYWITMKGKKGENLHRVFVGQFMDKNEAAQFLKDKRILRNYPGSFIQEVSSSSNSP